MVITHIKREEVQAFIVSFVILFLETALFHILMFVHNYLEANMVISYALLGLAIGSITTYYFRKIDKLNFNVLTLLLMLSIAAAFINIVRFPSNTFLSPFIILPFLLGNVAITSFYMRANANRIYFFSLTGATAGVFFAVWSIPLLKSENAVFACIALLSVMALIGQGKRFRKSGIVIFSALLVGVVFLIGFNLKYHNFELERITKRDGQSPGKVFSIIKKNRNDYGLVLSKDNLISRISVIGNKRDKSRFVYFDGDSNDTIRIGRIFRTGNDPRVPFMHKKPGSDKGEIYLKDPEVLIIGPAAQGIVKPLKYLAKDPAKIDAVEINPAIVDIMMEEMFEYSGRAYEGLSVYVMDGRAFLGQTKKRYDLITLLNTYKVMNIGYFGEPDFIHTKEAFNEYFDHLTDNGFILLEERDLNRNGKFAIFRLLNNIITVLKERGYEYPEKHFFVYNWNYPKGAASNRWYTMIVVKKTPLDEDDIAYFKKWIPNRKLLRKRSKVRLRMEYLPGKSLGTDYARFILSGDEGRENFFGKKISLKPSTDDWPYIFAVRKDKRGLKKMLICVGSVCLLLFFGIMVIFAVTFKSKFKKLPSIFTVYFIFLGLGYFIAEIGLINFYQKYTGSPTNSFIFILGSLLFASGIGSYCSRQYNTRAVKLSFAGIILVLLYHLFINKYLIGALHLKIMANNVLIALTVFPLGYFMGIPFPFGVERVKKSFGEKYVALFYAVNCIASTFAIVFGIYFSVVAGFMITFTVAIVCYLAALLLIFCLGKLPLSD